MFFSVFHSLIHNIEHATTQLIDLKHTLDQNKLKKKKHFKGVTESTLKENPYIGSFLSYSQLFTAANMVQ